MGTDAQLGRWEVLEMGVVTVAQCVSKLTAELCTEEELRWEVLFLCTWPREKVKRKWVFNAHLLGFP